MMCSHSGHCRYGVAKHSKAKINAVASRDILIAKLLLLPSFDGCQKPYVLSIVKVHVQINLNSATRRRNVNLYLIPCTVNHGSLQYARSCGMYIQRDKSSPNQLPSSIVKRWRLKLCHLCL